MFTGNGNGGFGVWSRNETQAQLPNSANVRVVTLIRSAGAAISCSVGPPWDPGVVDFWNVPAGTTASQTIWCLNQGATTLSIDGVDVTGDTNRFSAQILSGLIQPGSIAPGQSILIQINFTPATNKDADGAVLMISNNGGQGYPYRVILGGTGA
jgi:hypothetical protein